MAEQTVMHIGENSPEHVAYRLMKDVALVEKKALHASPGSDQTSADHAWILDTYAECVRAVKAERSSPGMEAVTNIERTIVDPA